MLRTFLFLSYVLVMKKFSPRVYLKTIQSYKVRDLQITPYVAKFFAKTDLICEYDISSVTSITCAGAPLHKLVDQELQKRFNISNVRQRYGMTETTVGIMGYKTNKTYPSGCIGDVFPGVSVKVIDLKTTKALGPMNTGEICCRTDMVMKGYINDLQATKKMIDANGWLRTGDIGYYDSSYHFFIVDRLKDLIKCKSFQVAPVELEALLITHPKIADAGVIGIPDEIFGEVPLACVVKVSGKNLTEKEVQDFVSGQVAPYKQLRGGVRFVPHIPRNSIGKTQRHLLKDELNRFKSSL